VSLQCPRCGLFSPANSQRCDCGWDFKELKAPATVTLPPPTNYHQWLRRLNAGPLALGIPGVALVVAAVPATIVFAVAGLGFFPPGTYPRLLLAFPGLVAGCLLSYGLGFLVYRLPPIWGYLACAFAGAVSTWLIFLWAGANHVWS
jgi:hypothetical protein